MKSIMAAAFLSLSAGAALSEDCIDLNMDVYRVDPETWKVHGEYLDFEGGDRIAYGDHFRVKMRGEKPGVYRLWTIDPQEVQNHDYPLVQSSSGPVTLPCGTEQDLRTCPDAPGAPFRAVDKAEGLEAAPLVTELLMISYTPCRKAGDPVGKVALPLCAGIVDPAYDMAQSVAHIGRAEALEIARPSRKGCPYERDTEDNIIIHKVVEIPVVR